MLKYYCYRHIRKDKNIPFYIGIGTISKEKNTEYSRYSRMNCKTDRNDVWNKIVAKTDYTAQVIYESNDLSEIKKKEKEMIALYGRMINGGILCNMTDGGDGVVNLDREKIEKIALFNRGTKRNKNSIEKMRDAKRKKSKKIINIETNQIFDSCSDAERYYFGERNKAIYNALIRTNGIMKKYKISFKYIN